MGNVFTNWRKRKVEGFETYGDDNIHTRMPKKTKQERLNEKIAEYNKKIAANEEKIKSRLSYMRTKQQYNAVRAQYFKTAHPFIARLEEMGMQKLANAHRTRINSHFARHAKRAHIKHRHLHHKKHRRHKVYYEYR